MEEKEPAYRVLKVTIVGDNKVGKTSLLFSFADGKVPTEYVPQTFPVWHHDPYNPPETPIEIDGQKYYLDFCDTLGDEDNERIRPLCYPGTRVFLLVFSINSPTSFNHIKDYYIPELQKYFANINSNNNNDKTDKGKKTQSEHPLFLLVGNKEDLREDETTIAKLKELGEGLHPVTTEEGEKLAEELTEFGCFKYVECSALTGNGVKEVFETAVRAVLWHKEEEKKKGRCFLS